MKILKKILSVYYKMRNKKFFICTEKEWRSLNANQRQEILQTYHFFPFLSFYPPVETQAFLSRK